MGIPVQAPKIETLGPPLHKHHGRKFRSNYELRCNIVGHTHSRQTDSQRPNDCSYKSDTPSCLTNGLRALVRKREGNLRVIKFICATLY